MTRERAETCLESLAAEGTVPPDQFADCPERTAEVAHIALEIPDCENAVQQIMDRGFFQRERVEDAVVSALLGNVIFAGPPGTGKTMLSGLLADAFNVGLRKETANAEWSVYDVIGSRTLNAGGGTEPKHGIVTATILNCAATTVSYLDSGSGLQGEWLLIDEVNRAEIDRAFGPLFTAISGSNEGAYSLDYMDGFPLITIPRRFRILCTMNDYDTRFVNSMSGALRRRFARVLVLPPDNVDGMIPEREWEVAIDAAHTVVRERLGSVADSCRAALETQRDLLRRVFGAIRKVKGHEGIAVGTSQVIDCCAYGMGYLSVVPHPHSTDEWGNLLDRILETRLVSGLETDSTRIRISNDYVEALSAEFPRLSRTTARLYRFLRGAA